jgi:hypothetical protein
MENCDHQQCANGTHSVCCMPFRQEFDKALTLTHNGEMCRPIDLDEKILESPLFLWRLFVAEYKNKGLNQDQTLE